jgi:hypothetical protein
MHPGFYGWWRSRGHGGDREHMCEGWGGHGRHHHHHDHHEGHFEARFAPGFDHDPTSAFGVRRPLRFLAHKLELDERQVALFAAVLDELKTERAQAAVDQRRRISALAEALEGTTFDEGKAHGAGEEQVKSAERVQKAVEHALKKMHAALDDEQRKKLAYLLRMGVLSI